MSERVVSENIPWSLPKRISTVFVLCYLLLYMFPFPCTEIPGLSDVFSVYTKPIEIAVLWFGKTILGISTLKKIQITGSGDTTFDYVKLLFQFLVSIVLTVIITVTSKKKEFRKTFELVWIYARYYVGLYLIIYGMVKFVDGQFSFPYLNRLEKTFGESSPMGLLWTFMGYSKAYTVFGGFFELSAGLLLLFRRTTVAGALIAVGVMLNVAMLNFCYDVGVKLFSAHLVLISLFILSPYAVPLFQFVFQQKTVQLKVAELTFEKQWQRIGRITFKSLLLVASIAAFGMMISQAAMPFQAPNYAKSFDGTYEVITFIKNNDTLPPLTTDSLRWNKIIMQEGDGIIKTMTGNQSFYNAKTDTINHKVVLTMYEDSTKVYRFNYKHQPNKQFVLNGKFQSDSLHIVCKHKTIDDYLLVNRGFHWINEQAFNK